MGKYLHKLGEFAFNHPWRIIAAWIMTLGLLGLLAVIFIKPTSSSISIPGTEAQKAIDRAGELFKGSGGGSGRIVFNARNGTRIDNHSQVIGRLTSDVAKVNGVNLVVSPFTDISFISRSGTIAYAQIQFKNNSGSINKDTIATIVRKVNTARSRDLQIEIGGDLVSHTPGEIIGVGEIGGVVIALMVLVITFGSLVAAGMPLFSAVTAVAVSMAGLFAMSHLFEIGSTTPVLAVMLGLAVGIDYALFIINKYRNYLLRGLTYKQATARSLGTAGNAVVFAAITVVIALSALSVVNIPFMTTMGLVGAGSIAVSAMVATTLTPAILRLVGGKILSKKQRNAMAEPQIAKRRKGAINRASMWYKWGELLVKQPIIALILGLVVVATVALPAQHLVLGLPTDEYAAKDTSQRRAYNLLTQGFGVGFNAPLTVVVEGLPKVSDADRNAVKKAALDEFDNQVAVTSASQQAELAVESEQAITPAQKTALQQKIVAMKAAGEREKQQALAQINANATKYARIVQLKQVADKIANYNNVQKTLPAVVNNNGTAGIIQVIPKTAPVSPQTTNLITALRNKLTQQQLTTSSNVRFSVTGSTTLQGDINKKLSDALPVYLMVVVGLSLLLLIIAFRSILIPIKATLGFLLSVLAMFGAIVAVFQWGWLGIADAPGPIVSFIPIIAIGILFGLAMDYEFFLVSGMHEAYARTKRPKTAVIEGFGAGSKVVTAAAAIMISVFGGFITNHDVTIQSIGFGLSIGILIDAFIVRMTIVPAVMALLGSAAWWLPKWLDKYLPHISIDGEDS